MAHENCDPSANVGKEVTCDGCNRTYIVTVYDDHYCAGFDANHYCEGCLIQQGFKAYLDSCVADQHMESVHSDGSECLDGCDKPPVNRDSILVQTQTTDGQVIDTRMQQL